MTEGDSWALLHTCVTGFEAEMLQQQLEAEEIPVLVRGGRAGIFGAGYQGGVPGGIELLVPLSALEEARAIIGGEDESPESPESSDLTEPTP